jgi:hypothetical protein
MSGAIPPLPNTPSRRGAQLKHRDKFTFTFYYFLMLQAFGNPSSWGQSGIMDVKVLQVMRKVPNIPAGHSLKLITA